MKIFELRKDATVVDWLNTLKSDATVNSYLLGMQTYTEWIQKTPEELIDEAEADAPLLMRKRHIKVYLINYKMHLNNKKLAPLSIKNYMTAVRAFYTFYDIELPSLPKDKAKTLPENTAIPSKEDIREVLKICDPLARAILLVGASSGLSSNELIHLKVSDFKHGYDPETGITTLKLRRLKTEIDFITFLTPEASQAVWDYLSYRERSIKTTEIRRVDQLEKQHVISENNYLFCLRHVPNKYLESKSEDDRRLTRSGIMRIYHEMSEKAQKNTEKGNYNLIRSHNIRKWFNSTLLNSGMDFFHVELLMGHTLPATQAHYFRAAPEKIKEIYKKYIPYLTIQKELDVAASPEYQEIVRQNEILRTETKRHMVERHEFKDVVNAINKLGIPLQKPISENASPEEKESYEMMKKIDERGIKLQKELKRILKID
jgi:integrase